MSESIEVSIFPDRWTSIAAIGAGFITNESDNIVKYKESATQPTSGDTVGHTLQRRDRVRYELMPTLQVWARTIFPNITIDVDALLLVTPD